MEGATCEGLWRGLCLSLLAFGGTLSLGGLDDLLGLIISHLCDLMPE